MKRLTPRTGVGASSIMLIIVVLCLTAFAVLTLITATVDLRLTERTVETVQRYYAADGAAQRRLSDIDAALLAGGDPAAWQDVTVDPTDPALVSFLVDAGDGRAIRVSLRLSDGTGAPRYAIVSYRLVSTEGWGAEPAPGLLTIED